MQVVMLVSGFPEPGRPNRGVFNLCAAQALGQMAHVSVVHMRAWKPGRPVFTVADYEGVRVSRVAIPMAPGNLALSMALTRYAAWARIRRLLRGCDLVHSVGAVIAGVVASTWTRWAELPHVTELIGSDVNTILPQMRSTRGVLGWQERLGGVACNSDGLAKAFLALYPGSRNVRAIYRGVDLERFQPSGPVMPSLADRPPVRYLFLGGFPVYPKCFPHGTNTKGGETLLAVWQAAEADLAAAGASLVIAGPGSDTERVSRWRADLRFPERVHLAGLLTPEAVPSYIRSADVVLLPSMDEGQPAVAREASACGRPVFASEVGGTPEVVVHEETGLLLPAGDVAAWKNTLTQYATQPFLLRSMGERARRRMEEKFDSRQYAPKMLDLYHTVLAEASNDSRPEDTRPHGLRPSGPAARSRANSGMPMGCWGMRR
jgi:glycosyltransferase involved in cell wall biosynthesis